MDLLRLTLSDLAGNLALDEALLLEAEEGKRDEVLRLWEWPHPSVVLGAAGRLAEEVDEAACRRGGVPIFRRASGGGTVLLGSGCLIYSLILAYERQPALTEVAPSYHFILGRIRDALADAVPGVELAGNSDLALGGRKFSGNSQQRKRTHLLHHGTLLYRFDLAAVGRYLRLPARQPAYRQGRYHEDFLRNLPLGREELERRLCAAWDAADEVSWPADRVRQLAADKYTRPEWIRRR
jgi:lipoate-protein ligase A